MPVCGYKVDVDSLAEDYFDDKPLTWDRWKQTDEGLTNTYACQREVWDDTDRCVWHADSDFKRVDDFLEYRADEPERLDGAKISNVDAQLDFDDCSLQQAEFDNVELEHSSFVNTNLLFAEFSNYCAFNGSDFTRARLEDVTAEGVGFFNCTLSNSKLSGNFTGAGFSGADISNSSLAGDFSEASFHKTNLSDCSAEGVDFSNSGLGAADMTRSDLRGADLCNARLYQTQLSGIQINDRTNFGDRTVYETDSSIDIIIDTSWDVHRFEAAAWVYRRIQSICQEQALSEKARHFHVRKREARRKLAWCDNNYLSAIVSETDRFLTRHGESPRRVLFWSISTLLLSTGLYSIGGIQYDGAKYILLGDSGVNNPFFVISMSLYFSISSFSTGGYGDVLPASDLSRTIAGAESLIGTLLIALFIFVLGRRVTW